MIGTGIPAHQEAEGSCWAATTQNSGETVQVVLAQSFMITIIQEIHQLRDGGSMEPKLFTIGDPPIVLHARCSEFFAIRITPTSRSTNKYRMTEALMGFTLMSAITMGLKLSRSQSTYMIMFGVPFGWPMRWLLDL